MVEIYFTRPRSFNPFSWLIRKFQKVPYSHVTIRAGSYVYESTFPFSKRTHVEEFKKHCIIVHKKVIDFDKNDGHKIRRYLEMQTGRLYSLAQIFAIFGDMSGIRFLRGKSHDNDYARMICSELVYLFYQEFMTGEYNSDSDMVDLIEVYTMVFLDGRVWKGKENDFSGFICR